MIGNLKGAKAMGQHPIPALVSYLIQEILDYRDIFCRMDHNDLKGCICGFNCQFWCESPQNSLKMKGNIIICLAETWLRYFLAADCLNIALGGSCCKWQRTEPVCPQEIIAYYFCMVIVMVDENLLK